MHCIISSANSPRWLLGKSGGKGHTGLSIACVTAFGIRNVPKGITTFHFIPLENRGKVTQSKIMLSERMKNKFRLVDAVRFKAIISPTHPQKLLFDRKVLS